MAFASKLGVLAGPIAACGAVYAGWRYLGDQKVSSNSHVEGAIDLLSTTAALINFLCSVLRVAGYCHSLCVCCSQHYRGCDSGAGADKVEGFE